MKLEVAVRKQFPGFALDASFTLAHERVGVFGDSGSGKSTLAGLIAGLQAPDEGEIRLNGECLFSRSRRINLAPERRRLGMVFQEALLFPHLSVRDNLLFGWRRRPRAEHGIDWDRLMAVLRLEPLLGRGVSCLSGGERQRVAIGRAVLSNPRLLILDEPLSALDERLKFQMIAYLNELGVAFGIPFLFISHSLVELRLLADTVLQIEAGRAERTAGAEQLARRQMTGSGEAYVNLLQLARSETVAGLPVYQWGLNRITATARGVSATALFELSSRDIILCKKHPEAVSARNLLPGRVAEVFDVGRKLGVALDCRGQRLVAEIVRSAAEELAVRPRVQLFAAFKASALRLLGE